MRVFFKHGEKKKQRWRCVTEHLSLCLVGCKTVGYLRNGDKLVPNMVSFQCNGMRDTMRWFCVGYQGYPHNYHCLGHIIIDLASEEHAPGFQHLLLARPFTCQNDPKSYHVWGMLLFWWTTQTSSLLDSVPFTSAFLISPSCTRCTRAPAPNLLSWWLPFWAQQAFWPAQLVFWPARPAFWRAPLVAEAPRKQDSQKLDTMWSNLFAVLFLLDDSPEIARHFLTRFRVLRWSNTSFTCQLAGKKVDWKFAPSATKPSSLSNCSHGACHEGLLGNSNAPLAAAAATS